MNEVHKYRTIPSTIPKRTSWSCWSCRFIFHEREAALDETILSAMKKSKWICRLSRESLRDAKSYSVWDKQFQLLPMSLNLFCGRIEGILPTHRSIWETAILGLSACFYELTLQASTTPRQSFHWVLPFAASSNERVRSKLWKGKSLALCLKSK